MRKKIIAGNWKMNKTPAEGAALAAEIRKVIPAGCKVEVVICPPYTALAGAAEAINGSDIRLGAQNCWHLPQGAYTGEISVDMLRSMFCKYVIVGHSERRQYLRETDADINAKAKAILAGGLRPIICVGETLDERETGKTMDVIGAQVRGCLEGITAAQMKEVVIAYEPVWAIGTGKTASSAQAQEVHAFIRAQMAALYDDATAQGVRIQYGGSMKPGNAKELLSMPDIDGGLIGGAALEAKSFADIVLAGV